jgi:hypothetical protein
VSHDDALERLLAEHADADACGLLADGPTVAERDRFDREVARFTAPAKPAFGWSRLVWPGVAAAMAVGVALWGFFGGEPTRAPDAEQIRDRKAQDVPLVTFLGGRGKLLPVGHDTRYTLVDAARVRLEKGELLVELPDGEGLVADIETAAGTATALGTGFYAHYAGAGEPLPGSFLTVAVLGGFVEVRNPHGSALAGAGEVVFADQRSAPRRQPGTPAASLPERAWWRFGNVPGLLQRSEVQSELKLTDEQKEKLRRPAGDDWREFGKFFRVPAEQRSKKAAEFRAAQEEQIAEILDAGQQRRLGQILLQQRGLAALADDKVSETLGLSPKQRQSAASAIKEVGSSRRSLFSGKGKGKDMGKWMAEQRRQEDKKLAALLTESQREQWRELIGTPFELQRSAGDWRDWWDAPGFGWWESGKWTDWRDADPGRSRPGPGWGPGPPWRDRWDLPPKRGPRR